METLQLIHEVLVMRKDGKDMGVIQYFKRYHYPESILTFTNHLKLLITYLQIQCHS